MLEHFVDPGIRTLKKSSAKALNAVKMIHLDTHSVSAQYSKNPIYGFPTKRHGHGIYRWKIRDKHHGMAALATGERNSPPLRGSGSNRYQQQQ